VIFVVQLRFSTNIDMENPGFAIRNMIYSHGEFLIHQTCGISTPRGAVLDDAVIGKMMARSCGFRIYPLVN
jgi:hypothetical protein